MSHNKTNERSGKQNRRHSPNSQSATNVHNRKTVSGPAPPIANSTNSYDDPRNSSLASTKTSFSLLNVSSTDRRFKDEKTSKQRRNIPSEASLSHFDSNELYDTHHMTDEIKKEFSRSNFADIAGSKFDPEKFFRPGSSDIAYFDRQVNAHKILDFMTTYMYAYFDLDADPKPYSNRREKLDENLWDQLAFVIPIICRNVIDEVLKDEQLVVTLVPNAVIFGDIHGNFSDIFFIYKHYITNKKYSSYKFVFLGDYVDRGPKSMEVVMFLLTCKLVDPKRFILLRGNHEVSKVNTKYGFKCLVETIYQDTYLRTKGVLPHLIYESFIQVFNYLPVAAAIRFKDKKGIFCCHGGIPNESYKSDHSAWKISDINNFFTAFKPHNLVPKKNSPIPQSVLNEILWNDPIPKKVWQKRKNHHSKLFYKNKKRGGHCSWFTEEATKRFLKANYLRLVVRGHQYKNTREGGFSYHFPDSEVLTVFSSSNYCGIEDNVTGCVVVTEEHSHSGENENTGDIHPRVLRPIDESKNYRQFNAFELIVDENKKVIGVVY